MIYGAVSFIRNEDKVLLLQRNGREENNYLYVAPGGKILRGESGLRCILRKAEEKTGLELINPRLRANAVIYECNETLQDPPGNEDRCLEIYESGIFNGELREGKKGKPIWVNENDLPKIRMHDRDKYLLGLLNQRGVFSVLIQLSRGENYKI